MTDEKDQEIVKLQNAVKGMTAQLLAYKQKTADLLDEVITLKTNHMLMSESRNEILKELNVIKPINKSLHKQNDELMEKFKMLEDQVSKLQENKDAVDQGQE